MSPSVVALCVHCDDIVFGPAADSDRASHPCCSFWFGEQGRTVCPSCALSKAEPPTRSEPDYEAQARAKQARLPPCVLCGGPLWLDQPGTHHVCAPGRHSAPGRALAGAGRGAL